LNTDVHSRLTPRAKLGAARRALELSRALARQFDYPVLARGGAHGVSDDLIAGYDPQSALVAPLRALRSELMLRWYPDSRRRVLSIVSPERYEGRSWLVANLATAFSQIGLRTLVIDADLRHPRQQQLFNLHGQGGLCELLGGHMAGDAAVMHIHPQLPLFVLGAGNAPQSPQELLSRPALEAVINGFAKQFDLLILDTPAASQTADAQIIAAHGGSALLLARQNHTRHAQLGQTMKSLKHNGVKIVGSIVSEH
jgi:protein-tyrosine kinase